MTDLDSNEAGRSGSRQGELGEGAHPDEALSRALEGALFPLDRNGLVLVARENEADAALLGALSSLPARTYRSADAVSEALAPKG